MAGHSRLSGQDTSPSRSPRAASSSRRTSRQQHTGKMDTSYIGQASWLSSVVNLVNTIVGAGVLAMPLALSHMGVLLGVLVIVWAGLTAGFGLYLQTRCARYLDRGAASFFALSQITYPKASIIFDAAIAIKCFGVGISYLIIIGDLMPGVVVGFTNGLDGSSFLLNRRFWVTAFMLIVIPFSFLRRLDSLKYTSVVALISIGYLVVLVVAHFAMGDTYDSRGSIHWIKWSGAVPSLSSLPVIVFAYTCHQNMFSILNEMRDNRPVKTTSVVTTSIGSACLVYLVVAIAGYLSFGDNVVGNIISIYTPSVASTVGKAAIVILVMFSYALQVHPCRASVDAVLKWRPTGPTRNEASPSRTAPLLGPQKGPLAPKPEPMGETRFATITTIIIILSYTVAMTVSSLEKVLAYVGSTGSTAISFILPGLFFYKISAPDSPYQQRLSKADDDDEDGNETVPSGEEDDTMTRSGQLKLSTRRQMVRRLSLALAIYGLLVMVVCLVTNTFFIVAN